MKPINIKRGWYWSIGDKFGWVNANHSREGVGLDVKKIKGMDPIVVTIKDSPLTYSVPRQKAVDFVKQFKSKEQFKKVTMIYLPRTIFDREDVEWEEPKTKPVEKPVDRQQSLWQ